MSDEDFSDPESQRVLEATAVAMAGELGRQAAREWFEFITHRHGQMSGDMTADEFESGYAKRCGLPVAELRRAGRVVKPCRCGEPNCPGWQSVGG